MSDGYIGLFTVPDEGAQLAVLNSQGTIVASEIVDKPFHVKTTKTQIALSAVDVASGSVMIVGVEYKHAILPAINTVFFGGGDTTVNATDGDTVTILARVYTFKTVVAAVVDQIKIGATAFDTALNFLKTINLSGTGGTTYGTGTTISADAVASMDGVNVILRAKVPVSGNSFGNTITLATSATPRIALDNATFFGGVDEDASWTNAGTFPAVQSTGNAGWSGSTNNSGLLLVPDLACSLSGIPYKFRVRMYNSDGQQAVSTSSVVLETITSVIYLNGINDLAESVEVYDLCADNASNKEGDPATPATLPPGGIIRLTWSEMRKYTRLKGQKNAAGALVDITESQLAQISGYVVYMYIATAALAPANPYPSTTEVNGTWFLVMKTANCYAEIQCPKNKKIAFWVGFETANTQQTTAAPKGKLPLSQY